MLALVFTKRITTSFASLKAIHRKYTKQHCFVSAIYMILLIYLDLFLGFTLFSCGIGPWTRHEGNIGTLFYLKKQQEDGDNEDQ